MKAAVSICRRPQRGRRERNTLIVSNGHPVFFINHFCLGLTLFPQVTLCATFAHYDKCDISAFYNLVLMLRHPDLNMGSGQQPLQHLLLNLLFIIPCQSHWLLDISWQSTACTAMRSIRWSSLSRFQFKGLCQKVVSLLGICQVSTKLHYLDGNYHSFLGKYFPLGLHAGSYLNKTSGSTYFFPACQNEILIMGPINPDAASLFFITKVSLLKIYSCHAN